MLELFLIRHGATALNEAGIYQGQRDVPLSDLGRAQARRVAGRLREAVPHFANLPAYSSDLSRAMETARLAVAPAVLHTDARLREFGFGAYEGLTAAENEARDPSFANWLSDPENFTPPGGESLVDVRARVTQWLHEYADASPALIFTHGGIMRMMISVVSAVPFPAPRQLRIAPTDILRLRLDDGRRCPAESIAWLRAPVDGPDPYAR